MVAPQLTQYINGRAQVTADMLNTFAQTCDTFANLRTFIGTTGMQVYTRGGAAIDDGGQGFFYWDATSVGADDGYDIIRPSGAAYVGRWVRLQALNSDNYAATRTILALRPVGVGAIVYLGEGYRVGWFIWQYGDYTAQVTSDPQQGIYVAGNGTPVTTGAWVRIWDGTNGIPEWFGAVPDDATVDNVTAIEACFVLCQTTSLGARDYYIQSTLTFNNSVANFYGVNSSGTDAGIGTGLPLGMPGGTRIILTGAAVQNQIVFQFGKVRANLPSPPVDNITLMRHSNVAGILFGRDQSTFQVNPATSSDPSTSVMGVVCSFMSDCTMTGCHSMNSPVGFRYEGCVTSTFKDLNAALSNIPSGSSNRFFVGHLIGGYIVNFGYVGANASIYLYHCTTFDAPAGLNNSWGFRLFGAVADTFTSTLEMARCAIGFEIDGRDASGAVITSGGAHQDITILDYIGDGCNGPSIWWHDMSNSFMVEATNLYMAGINGYGMIIENCGGMMTVVGGKLIQGGHEGIRITNVNNINMGGIQIRDSTSPVQLENVRYSLIAPQVFQQAVSANQAINMVTTCEWNTVGPSVTESPGLLNSGFEMDSSCAHNEIDPTRIQYDQMATPTSAWKVRFNGADATTGAGLTAFTGAGNVFTGVTG